MVTAFQKIYEEYAQPLYRFLLSLSGREDLAEELLQETFFQAYQHIGKFEGRCNLYTWLCQIGKNAWIKEYHRSKRYSTVSLEDLTIPVTSPSPEEQIIAKEEYLKAQKAIQQLPNPYRDVFILHAIGNIKLREIAYIHQKSESWARVTYFRAKHLIIQEVSK